MTTTRQRGRPKTGRLSPFERKRALIESGGRIMQIRLTFGPNAALLALVASGEFNTSTKAISAALIEAASNRQIFKR